MTIPEKRRLKGVLVWRLLGLMSEEAAVCPPTAAQARERHHIP